MSRQPSDHWKIIVRPRGGLDVETVGSARLGRAIAQAAGIAPTLIVTLLRLGWTTMTHRNGQAAGLDPDLGPEVTPEARKMQPRLKAEPSPGTEIIVDPNLEAHRTQGAGPGTRVEQSVSKAHPSRRCRVASGLTGCVVEEV
ncbi:hypothetical protein MRX96_009848 [Rhipicephalus microplus]